MAFGVGVVVYLSAAGSSGSSPTESAVARPDVVTLTSAGKVLARVAHERAERIATGDTALPVESERTVRRGRVTRTIAVDEALLRQDLAATEGGAIVEVSERVVASRVETPIIQQIYTNNCETAALSMLLGSVGVEQDQRQLQDQVAVAEPLDPETNINGQMVWGDPNEGFVGRPPGGGPAGGFGVFERPVIELASRWAEPVNLTQVRPSAIYRTLRSGRAVMTWIGLSDGPYESWLTPDGTDVTVNFGEHTVVLTGIADDQIYVNDPLDGLRKVWTKAEFEAKWDLLDRRAISL